MEQLTRLCALEGVSGFEFDAARQIRALFDTVCERTETDALGNVAGIIGAGKKKKIMIEAHMDEIGLMVKRIDSNGFISFVAIG
ncbi:MAG: M42 family peptidase, partial [Clostridiales bacterium]|nr:M42 family peptidase [Clostridiales bacterium]